MIYSKSGNILHCKNRDGEWWHECDERGNRIHSISRIDWLGYASNIEEWREYTFWPNGKIKTKVEYWIFNEENF